MVQGLTERRVLGCSALPANRFRTTGPFYLPQQILLTLGLGQSSSRHLLKKHEKDPSSRTSLQGVLLRMDPLAEGDMQTMYGPGEDTIAIEDLGLLGPDDDDRWGITMIEGGAEMDEYAKAALFSLLDTILYLDAVKRRREVARWRHFPPMQIFFEEANKIISGVSGGAASDQAAPPPVKARSPKPSSTSSATGANTACSRTSWCKLSLRHPDGLLSSCGNLFVYQTKNPKDRDLVLAHIGRSEKGMVNTEYKRYLARIPREYAVVKLGYSTEVNDMEPMLVHPLMIRGHEPSDAEILARLTLLHNGG